VHKVGNKIEFFMIVGKKLR